MIDKDELDLRRSDEILDEVVSELKEAKKLLVATKDYLSSKTDEKSRDLYTRIEAFLLLGRIEK